MKNRPAVFWKFTLDSDKYSIENWLIFKLHRACFWSQSPRLAQIYLVDLIGNQTSPHQIQSSISNRRLRSEIRIYQFLFSKLLKCYLKWRYSKWRSWQKEGIYQNSQRASFLLLILYKYHHKSTDFPWAYFKIFICPNFHVKQQSNISNILKRVQLKICLWFAFFSVYDHALIFKNGFIYTSFAKISKGAASVFKIPIKKGKVKETENQLRGSLEGLVWLGKG